ncbi:MAG TPA: GNAT family N-acetyltransferase [Tepidisphaeraceae bacterium]|jgi:ribosomal protein S18 acetylase RimI-like enzyme
MIDAPAITYRRIDPQRDGQLTYAHFRQTSRASFGRGASITSFSQYLHWLRGRVEEFPEGHLLAYEAEDLVGQIELQVPYGLSAGYVNLFYVTAGFRRQGYGRRLHERALGYFRSWEATSIELHVSPTNEAAVAFYRAMGYRKVGDGWQGEYPLWKMARRVG